MPVHRVSRSSSTLALRMPTVSAPTLFLNGVLDIGKRGFAVRMKWDGRYYVRGHDKLVWNSGEPGTKYTPEEFRRYWINWMVKTEYEAQMTRRAIDDTDCQKYLSDVRWWYERD
ncbi:uncharacterized protein EDB93DRAFT_678933 [Suillus bovinus]|uniref:uncharacterized protein n=1 Tax=Suillus bovinus TaxID=48563 RepID=UPI001B861154|nr:uncharacterized protein EDB93DRAFT_678933 [Suillus bovinus]KAG2140518.1 hypothetical protein EDB93DRAFT_678933 [Suillus bovinus]